MNWVRDEKSFFLEAYRSDDGRWLIEPAVNNDGPSDRAAAPWALTDCEADPNEWVATGTLEELKARAVSEGGEGATIR